MKILLLAFTFFLLLNFKTPALAGCGGYDTGNGFTGKAYPCRIHKEGKNYVFGEINKPFNFSDKKIKKVKLSMRGLASYAKSGCEYQNDKYRAYLFADESRMSNNLPWSETLNNQDDWRYIRILYFCANSEFEALEYYKDSSYRKNNFNPTHYYVNTNLNKFKIDFAKAKVENKLNKAKKLQPLKDDCKDLGFTENTEAMGNCILKLMELKQSTNSTGQSQSSDDTSVSEWLGIANDGINMMNDNSSSSQTCFKTGEVKQAFNKICEYKCGLTTYTTNLGSGVGLCPSTIQR